LSCCRRVNAPAQAVDHIPQVERSGDYGRPWPAYVSGAFGLALTAQINFLVPLRARELGADFDIIGLIVAAGALASAVLAVSAGAMIDRLGPKMAFLVGTAGTALVSLGFAAVSDFWWFLALQPLHGVFRNLGWLASQTYITQLGPTEGRSKRTGRFGLASNLGQMVGPVIAGAGASMVGFQLAMLVPAVYSLAFLVLGLCLANTPPPADREKVGTGSRAARGLLAIRGVQVILLLTTARLWISHVFGTFFPIALVEGGIPPSVAGSVMATAGLVAATTAPTAHVLTRRARPPSVLILALGLSASALILAPFAISLPTSFLIPALVGVGSGLSLPLLLVAMSDAVPQNRLGVALGLRGLVNQATATTAPAVIGPLMAGLGVALGFVSAGAAALAVLASAGVLYTRDRPEGTDRHAA